MGTEPIAHHFEPWVETSGFSRHGSAAPAAHPAALWLPGAVHRRARGPRLDHDLLRSFRRLRLDLRGRQEKAGVFRRPSRLRCPGDVLRGTGRPTGGFSRWWPYPKQGTQKERPNVWTELCRSFAQGCTSSMQSASGIYDLSGKAWRRLAERRGKGDETWTRKWNLKGPNWSELGRALKVKCKSA